MPIPVQFASRPSVQITAKREEKSGGTSFPDIMQSLGAHSAPKETEALAPSKAASATRPSTADAQESASSQTTEIPAESSTTPGDCESAGSENSKVSAGRGRRTKSQTSPLSAGSDTDDAGAAKLNAESSVIAVPVPLPTDTALQFVDPEHISQSDVVPIATSSEGDPIAHEPDTPQFLGGEVTTPIARPGSQEQSSTTNRPAVSRLETEAADANATTPPASGRIAEAPFSSELGVGTGRVRPQPHTATPAVLNPASDVAAARIAYTKMHQASRDTLQAEPMTGEDPQLLPTAGHVRVPRAAVSVPNNDVLAMPPDFAATASVQVSGSAAVSSANVTDTVAIRGQAPVQAVFSPAVQDVPLPSPQSQTTPEAIVDSATTHIAIPSQELLPTESPVSGNVSGPADKAVSTQAERVESRGTGAAPTRAAAAKQRDHISYTPNFDLRSVSGEHEKEFAPGSAMPQESKQTIPVENAPIATEALGTPVAAEAVSAEIVAATPHQTSMAPDRPLQSNTETEAAPTAPRTASRFEANLARGLDRSPKREPRVAEDSTNVVPAQQRTDSVSDKLTPSEHAASSASAAPTSNANLTHSSHVAATPVQTTQNATDVQPNRGNADKPAAPSHTAAAEPERAYTLVETARLVDRASSAEIRVGVHTPELGRVELHASLRDNSVGATLSVERPEVQRMFASELPNLNRTLDRHQVELQSVSLMDSSMQQPGSQPRQNPQQTPQQQSWPQAADTVSRSNDALRSHSNRASEVSSSPWVGSGLDLLA